MKSPSSMREKYHTVAFERESSNDITQQHLRERESKQWDHSPALEREREREMSNVTTQQH